MATAPSVRTPMDARLTGRPHRPWLAAVLSFIFPGLGQAYAGRLRTAAVFAVPVVLLVTVTLLLMGILGGVLRNWLLSSAFLVAALVLNVALLGWRSLAIWHAGLTGRTVRRRQRQAAAATVAMLILVAVAMHWWVGVVVAHLEGTLTQVFDQNAVTGGDDGGGSDGTGDVTGGEPDPDAPPPYRWDGTDRVNVLLVGTDAAPGRDEILTDVIMVASVDPESRTAVLISVPRDTGLLPLPDSTIYPDARFPGKASELATVAAADPAAWCPDRNVSRATCGILTLQRSVGLYVGLELHHYAKVDMAGFAELIDAIGGVELCLPGRLVDPQYDPTLRESGNALGLELPAGCHDYDGAEALSYARSRQGVIVMPEGTEVQQTDFDRNERQQLVLLAIRNELADADLLFELPALLSAVGRTVSTDFARDRAGDLASLLPLITRPDIERIVLGHPEFVDLPLQPEVNYLLVPKRDAIRDEMGRLFGHDELTGWYLATTDEVPSP